MIRGINWRQQRADIQSRMDIYFGREIDIAPIAMAALQGFDNGDNEAQDCDEYCCVFEESILENLLFVSRVACRVLKSCGIEPNNINFGITRHNPAPLSEASLDWIFQGNGADTEVSTAKIIRKTGNLDELDIMLSALEASLQGTEENAFGGLILESVGFKTCSKIRGHPDCIAEWKLRDKYLAALVERVKTRVRTLRSRSLRYIKYASPLIEILPQDVTSPA